MQRTRYLVRQIINKLNVQLLIMSINKLSIENNYNELKII